MQLGRFQENASAKAICITPRSLIRIVLKKMIKNILESIACGQSLGALSLEFSRRGHGGAAVCSLEQAGGNGAEEEAADVGQVGHSSGLGLRYLAGIEELG